jgi:uncharacterized membrane protein HdeD (DUF308 family)
MLVVRGTVAFLVGLVISNNSGLSAGTVLTLLGIWTLLDGVALVWQAYQPTHPGRPAEMHPSLRVVGAVGIVVGALIAVAPGLSNSLMIWLLAAWFTFRAVVQVAAVFSAVPGRAAAFLVLAAVADLGLVAMLLTHRTGSIESIALFGGGIAFGWGVLQMLLGTVAGKTPERETVGPRLLAPR